MAQTINRSTDIVDQLREEIPEAVVAVQHTRDQIPTLWIRADRILDATKFLKYQVPQPYRLLYDLTAIDERARIRPTEQPSSDFTLVYHLLSFERNHDIRLKVGLHQDRLTIDSITPVWPAANWYERETFDMFGIHFQGHPHLTRILMPPTWQGHPLQKGHPARATEMPSFTLPDAKYEHEQEADTFRPEDWGLKSTGRDSDFMFLNVGPHHPGTHGVLRLILQLDGEEIVTAIPEIGYHHRGVEKMGERQSWHTFIPYTDRVDYLAGVVNNLAYLLAVERLAGIVVPPRVEVMRVMLCELFRIASHLVWYGTFVQDVGAMSPVFYMFTDRERVFEVVEAICGDRMHPNWFRIGGVAQDLPRGWDRLMRNLLDYLPPRLKEYDQLVMRNAIFRARTKGVGRYSLDEAIEWGVTGPGLRATGFDWDFRKQRPYSGYDQFDFDVPVATRGDCYDRAVVRVEEMRQSLRIIRQCVDNMPAGPYKSDHPLTTPPRKERTMHDIETLIAHFLSVSWGPVIPEGEALHTIEATKGANGYYLISDGGPVPYRLRIRTPSFPHMQMVSLISRGAMIPDLLAILGSIDFVLADVDR